MENKANNIWDIHKPRGNGVQFGNQKNDDSFKMQNSNNDFNAFNTRHCDGPNWHFDLLEISYNVTKSDVVNFHLEVVRISRGVNGLSGYVDILKDIEKDEIIFEVIVSYHSLLSGIYIKLPLQMPHTTMTEGMNKCYRNYIDPTHECIKTKNAPVFDKFEFPLTARRIEFENCILGNENFPPHAKPGFYKINVFAVGFMMSQAEFILKVVY